MQSRNVSRSMNLNIYKTPQHCTVVCYTPRQDFNFALLDDAAFKIKIHFSVPHCCISATCIFFARGLCVCLFFLPEPNIVVSLKRMRVLCLSAQCCCQCDYRSSHYLFVLQTLPLGLPLLCTAEWQGFALLVQVPRG